MGGNSGVVIPNGPGNGAVVDPYNPNTGGGSNASGLSLSDVTMSILCLDCYDSFSNWDDFDTHGPDDYPFEVILNMSRMADLSTDPNPCGGNGTVGIISKEDEMINDIEDCLGVESEWLSNEATFEQISQISQYLTLNQCSEEAQILAILAIENNVDIDDLIYVIENEQDYRNQMSDDELNLFDTLSYEQQTLYLVSAKQALDKTNELFQTPCERYNGKGDAFRHAYWNALSSQRIGVGLTNLLTTRHENRPPLYAYDNKETEMDLFNNQIGRDIVYNGMTNLLLMQQAVQDAFDNGHLKYLNNQASNCRATFSSILIPTNQ